MEKYVFKYQLFLLSCCNFFLIIWRLDEYINDNVVFLNIFFFIIFSNLAGGSIEIGFFYMIVKENIKPIRYENSFVLTSQNY